MLKFGIIKSEGTLSLSSIMHTAALQHLNINGEYKEYGINSENLQKEFNRLKSSNIKGLNVTIPHKISIIPLLDELTETAKLISAVNTITFNNGKTIGDNTDIIGFWESIPEDIRNKIQDKNIAILGSGGTANAVAIACIQNNAKSIMVYGRDLKKLSEFKEFVDDTVQTLQCNVSTNTLDKIDLSNTFMLVNTTPVGMFPKINDSLISINDLKKLPKDAFVYDIIYNPQETKLLKDAKSLGLKTLNGVEMLVRQGAASLNIWLEKKIAPVEIMRLSIYQSLAATETL